MPITEQLSLVLFKGLNPHTVVPELMMRDLKDEMEGIINSTKQSPAG
jgi:glycerol-3-phosphate dehydrogenase (NAD(P)+)